MNTKLEDFFDHVYCLVSSLALPQSIWVDGAEVRLPREKLSVLFLADEGDTIKMRPSQSAIASFDQNHKLTSLTWAPIQDRPYEIIATDDWAWKNGCLHRKFVYRDGSGAWLRDLNLPPIIKQIVEMVHL